MRPFFAAVVVAALSSTLFGCADREEPQEVSPTPSEVTAQFHSLLDSMDVDLPGASAETLGTFLDKNSGYEIADTVRAEIEELLSLAGGRYREARELAREGHFDRAEKILLDLSRHFPDTDEGESAARYLEYEFYLGKAQWLLYRQRYKESGVVARSLLDHDLTPFQVDQVEAILDNVGHIDAAFAMMERQQAQAACRQLTILLETLYVEEGRYPSQLSLSDVEDLDRYGSQSVRKGLSSIDSYSATRDGYSFVAVSAEGRHRLRVVDGNIQE